MAQAWMMSLFIIPGINSNLEEVTVRLQEQGVQLSGWVSPSTSLVVKPITAVTSFVRKTLVIAELEVRKLRHDPTELITRAVQPMLWLLVFGQVFTRTRAIPTGNLPYIDFMAPGILAQSVLFVSIFYGIAIIWERDLGIVHKLLVSPTSRAAPGFGQGAIGRGAISVTGSHYLCPVFAAGRKNELESTYSGGGDVCRSDGGGVLLNVFAHHCLPG